MYADFARKLTGKVRLSDGNGDNSSPRFYGAVLFIIRKHQLSSPFVYALLSWRYPFVVVVLAASWACHFLPLLAPLQSREEEEADEEEGERGATGVYVGCHAHRFPESLADKHREHVVGARRRARIKSESNNERKKSTKCWVRICFSAYLEYLPERKSPLFRKTHRCS